MSWVIAKKNESIETLLKRFKKAVERSGVLSDYRKKEFHEKPSVIKRRKRAAARKRALKQARKLAKKPASRDTNTDNRYKWHWNKDRTKKIVMPAAKKPHAGNSVLKREDRKRFVANKTNHRTRNSSYKGNKK